MPEPRQPGIWPANGTALLLSLGLLALLIYSSTLVGPAGINFVPRSPADAWNAFLHMRFVPHGSDQQADWMGNLLALVPYGFLVAATLWPRRIGWLKPFAFVVALAWCVVTVLAVKYLQLFFPPRTVTLNYVLAQSLGCLIGCAGFVLWHETVGPTLLRRRDPVAALVTLLRLYLIALVVFVLMPLDFALQPADLAAQIARLPETLTAVPGAGRPVAIRVLVIVASVSAFVPVGMLLAFTKVAGRYRVGRGTVAAVTRGFCLAVALFILSTLVLSASPAAIAILYRTLGIAIGAAGLSWLVRQDLLRVRARAAATVPWLVIPYLLALALANQLVSGAWRSWPDAMAQTNPLGWLPLYDYYIVTKAEAAKNLVGHALMYLPVGLAVWLCAPRTGRMALAFCLGASLSMLVEVARYLRPGLEGDINAVAVGGLAAALALPLLDLAWALLAAIARRSASVPAPRSRDRRDLAPPPAGRAAGDVEEY
ncbi:VanZ family protein [Rhodopila sp.]|uniref:VanZ family protein n=1 Tax=Rhodopila sp. TaxID=2480087 RepID=UPI002D13C589|nr:VanZ family protein [Rhodopila sp.]HVZ08536.1 VanZ family protein [Rhodopila sp.]